MDTSRASIKPCGLFLFAVASLLALAAGAAERSLGAEGTPEHWMYEGNKSDAHWGMLSPAYMACEAGSHQSPINIAMPSHARTQEHLARMYLPSSGQAIHNGHTIQVNVEAGGGVLLNGRPYVLRQFHFHEPGEHHVDGKSYPMEMHLVHDDARGHILVVGVLLDIGTDNQELATIWRRLPGRVGERIVISALNVPALLPPDPHHFSYHGSLTTPPCTEGVQWIVLRQHLTVSKDQVEKFVASAGHNARQVQLLHGRTVKEE